MLVLAKSELEIQQLKEKHLAVTSSVVIVQIFDERINKPEIKEKNEKEGQQRRRRWNAEGAEGVRGGGGCSRETAETVADTRRLITKPPNLNDAYRPPSNFLEIDVSNPQTVGVGRGRFTTYEIRVKTNLPIFKLKESTVRRRYSDFEWLRSELERESKVVVPPLPGKAFLRQLPFRGDDGIFDDNFIEERKQGLEQFINKVAGHPLAQNERCLHMFLQDEIIDKSYTPSKIRHA
ncbi:sorting nexin-3-like [Mustela erminea]|uniref:sorting nexin-3-like n=1 Tax=Mustela erminea TaxID=36723 RepID=UPI0013871A0E|nr:sorting nexin-3-like [Mustela erminea]